MKCVLEDRLVDLVVVDVIRSASDASILTTTLPNELEHVIYTWQDIVLEDDRVEDLPRDKSSSWGVEY